MQYTKCLGKPRALEYNEKYLNNVKLACYCPFCSLTTKREPTPYKIIETDNGYVEIFDETYYEIKDKKYEEIPSSNNPHDPWGSNHRSPNDVCFYSTTENVTETEEEELEELEM